MKINLTGKLSAKLVGLSAVAIVICASVTQSLAQTSANETDIGWSKTLRPPIEQKERKLSPISIPENTGNSVEPIWSIETTDATLSNALMRWSRQEKWQLIWEADRDFPILATVYLKGSFQSAILSVMQSLSESDYPLQAVLHPNSRIVRIVRYMQTPNG